MCSPGWFILFNRNWHAFCLCLSKSFHLHFGSFSFFDIMWKHQEPLTVWQLFLMNGPTETLQNNFKVKYDCLFFLLWSGSNDMLPEFSMNGCLSFFAGHHGHFFIPAHFSSFYLIFILYSQYWPWKRVWMGWLLFTPTNTQKSLIIFNDNFLELALLEKNIPFDNWTISIWA